MSLFRLEYPNKHAVSKRGVNLSDTGQTFDTSANEARHIQVNELQIIL